MAEPKQVYRIPPCHSFDIPTMESWLEDMAAKGYILAKDSFFMGTATFELGAPRAIRYRLEATTTSPGLFSSNYDPDDEMIQLYHKMGWNYRGRRGQFFIFASEDPNATELNTDPQVQAHTIQALAKYQRSQMSNSILGSMFILWLNFSHYFFSGMIIAGTWVSLLLIGLFVSDFLRNLRNLIQLSRLKKQLQQGQPLPHRTDYHNKTNGYFTGRILRILLWGIATFFLIFNLTGKTVMPLNQLQQDLPFATLQDLYPDAEVTPWDSFRENKVTIWSDYLAPECYEYYESSNVTHPGQAPDTMWLSMLYIDTRWNWTARIIARELTYQAGASPMHQYFDEMFGDEPIILTEMDIEGADYAAYYYRHRGYPYIVLQKGSLVIRANIDIFGDGIAFTPEEFAEALVSHLS